MISQKQIAKYLDDKGYFKDAHVYIREFEQVDESLLVDLRVEQYGYNLTLSKIIPVIELTKYEE